MGYIELKNVTYTYPLAEEPSVRDISAVMERGKFYSILGANGPCAISCGDLFLIFTRVRCREK